MLERVERYVDAASSVCRAARDAGVSTTIVFLHCEAGPPVLNVDLGSNVTDEFRLTSGIGDVVWRVSPVFELLRRRVDMVGGEALDVGAFFQVSREHGYTGPDFHPFAVPLINPQGWFGTIVCGNAASLPVELERSIAMLATRLSVWCTERGVGRVPLVAGDGDLPARRYRIAQLAASGHPNSEIAQFLGISINTVKSRLKQVFLQLEVDNRTELAMTLRRLAPVRDVKLGVTRLDDVTVSRVAYPTGYSAGARRSATSG